MGRRCGACFAFSRTGYVSALPADTKQIILDIDSTDDETHGAQQLSFFSGFYRNHMYHPLMIFDGESGELISTLLRPGNVHASRGAVGLLRRIIRQIKQRFPQAQIAVRGDSGFCTPHMLESLEALNAELGDVEYLFGLAKNPVLLEKAAPAMSQAEELFRRRGEKSECFSCFSYAARTWSRPRFVVAKAEHSGMGANPRFVISSLEGFPPDLLYRLLPAHC